MSKAEYTYASGPPPHQPFPQVQQHGSMFSGPPPQQPFPQAQQHGIMFSGPPPLGLNSAFCRPQPTTLSVTPHSIWSGGDTDILGDDGLPLLKCQSHFISKKRDFLTRDGKPLFTLHRHSFSRERAFTIDAPSRAALATLHWHLNLGNTKLSVHFLNSAADGRAEVFEVRSHGFTGKESEITCNGRDVASVKRVGHFRPDWRVTVAPGVDQSLIAAIVVALVLIREAKNNAAASGGGGA